MEEPLPPHVRRERRKAGDLHLVGGGPQGDRRRCFPVGRRQDSHRVPAGWRESGLTGYMWRAR
jgi:hypothetical protein